MLDAHFSGLVELLTLGLGIFLPSNCLVNFKRDIAALITMECELFTYIILKWRSTTAEQSKGKQIEL